MNILAVETSCDETSAAIIQSSKNHITVKSNIISSQITLHKKFGGVVPNLAAREHMKNIIPVIAKTLKEANLKKEDVDLFAVTKGPGLIPALLIGTNTIKTLSYLLQKPLLGIHHIEGHIYANFLAIKSDISLFPNLVLVVSGGHTQLVLMKKHLHYEIIGETQDDAVGEAFDKVARMLGLPYPGGPEVSRRADLFSDTIGTLFPRPMLHSPDFNFSFSGLKTAVLYEIRKPENQEKLHDENFINYICHEFQEAAVDVLIKKTIRAAKKYTIKTIMLAGGVSANIKLRTSLEKEINKINSSENGLIQKIKYIKPELQYTTDNAAMIGIATAYRWRFMTKNQKNDALSYWKTLKTTANVRLE